MQLSNVKLLVFICLIFAASCTKKDFTTNSEDEIIFTTFFEHSNNSPVAVKRAIENLKLQNKKKPFIKDFILKYGYPKWEYAKVTYNSNSLKSGGNISNLENVDTLLNVPTVSNSEYFVRAVMSIKINQDFFYKYFNGNEYSNYGFDHNPDRLEPNAEDVALAIMKFEKLIFQTNLFKITDNRLLDYWTNGTIKPNYFFVKAVLPEVPEDSPNGDEDCVDWYETVSSDGGETWEDTGVSWSEGDCYEGSGSPIIIIDLGGTTGWNDQPWPGSGGSGTTTPNTPINICERGWLRYVPQNWCPGSNLPQPPAGYNMNLADSVIIDTSITNNYPCFDNLIDTLSTFGNLNQTAQVALATIFGVYKYMHIKLKLDPTLSGQNIDAETDPPIINGYPYPPDTLHFYSTIRFNPDLLNKGTKEFIVSTIVHEAMHSYIDYIFKLYQQGYIDSTEIKLKFPLFWRNSFYGLSPNQQHNIMANNWINLIVNSLNAFSPNPNLNQQERDSLYKALAWGGLDQTAVFQNLPNRCDISAINIVARDRFFNSVFTPLMPQGYPACSQSYSLTAQSLNLRNPCD